MHFEMDKECEILREKLEYYKVLVNGVIQITIDYTKTAEEVYCIISQNENSQLVFV